MQTAVLSGVLLALAVSVSARTGERQLQDRYNHVSFIADFCRHTHPVSVSVYDLLPRELTYGRSFFPDVTVLHRCEMLARCCEKTQKNGPLSVDKVSLPFEVTALQDFHDRQKGESKIEYFYFNNYTACGCGHKHGPFDIIDYLVPELEDHGTQEHHQSVHAHTSHHTTDREEGHQPPQVHGTQEHHQSVHANTSHHTPDREEGHQRPQVHGVQQHRDKDALKGNHGERNNEMFHYESSDTPVYVGTSHHGTTHEEEKHNSVHEEENVGLAHNQRFPTHEGGYETVYSRNADDNPSHESGQGHSNPLASTHDGQHSTRYDYRFPPTSTLEGSPVQDDNSFCRQPQPSNISVEELLSPTRTRGKSYFPQLMTLYRCNVVAHCCEGTKTNGPVHFNSVHLSLQVVYHENIGDKKKDDIDYEYYSFDNHTLCGCDYHRGPPRPAVNPVHGEHGHDLPTVMVKAPPTNPLKTSSPPVTTDSKVLHNGSHAGTAPESNTRWQESEHHHL